ncbi:MAG: DUF4388 domain-containing protein [bacterium]
MSLVGRLEDLALADIFQILSVGKKTGTLVVKSSKGNAFVVFRDGLVVRAEADMLDATILDDLLKSQVINQSAYAIAQSVKKDLRSKSFGEICLELNAVKRDQLDKAARKRIEKVVYNLLLWEEGQFQFELDDVSMLDRVDIRDTGWEIGKGMSPEYLLMEGARVYDETAHESFIPDEGLLDAPGEKHENWESPPVSQRKDISALKSLTQELRFPNSTSEITLLILRFASDIFQRGVLFMASSQEMVGLGQFGLEIEQADEKIREMVVKINESAFLQDLLKNMQSFKGPLPKDTGTEFLIQSFGGKWPKEVALYPVVAEKRVVAVLFCDNIVSGEPFTETEGLEIFIDQAGLALEKAILQRKLTDIGG